MRMNKTERISMWKIPTSQWEAWGVWGVWEAWEVCLEWEEWEVYLKWTAVWISQRLATLPNLIVS